MRKLSFFLALLLTFSLANSQNIGINNTDPNVSIDIKGGMATRAFTVTPVANEVNIPVNESFVIVGPGTSIVTCYASAFINGQRLILFNAGGFNLHFLTYTIPPNEAREFICRNPGGWSLLSGALNTEGWRITGNADIDTSVNFIGTTGDQPLVFKINNERAGLIDRGANTALGYLSLPVPTIDAAENTAVGAQTLRFLKDGAKNTAIGTEAAANLKSGNLNVAVGQFALLSDTAGSETVAVGPYALAYNQNREGNTALGAYALVSNALTYTSAILPSQGLQNTAIGNSALYSSQRGTGSVAIGYKAAYSDTAANGLIAIGRAALYNNKGREGNLAIGDSALYANGSGTLSDPIQAINNIAIGKKALLANRTGGGNIAIGNKSLISSFGGYYNIAIGNGALASCRSDSRNIAIGENAMQYACNTAPFSVSATRNNIAIGESALSGQVGMPNTQQLNVAIGDYAMQRNTSGQSNVAIGINALDYLESGVSNTAIGAFALRSNVSNNNIVAIGRNAGYLSTSSNKLFIESVETPPSIFPETTEGSTALIFGDFAADSLLLNGKTVVRNNAVVKGYTKLGGYDADVPSIKMKKISIPAGPAINTFQSYPLGSGITDAKVVGIQVLLNYAGSWKMPPGYIDVAGYEYNVQVQNNNIVIILKNGNSANIGGKPISIIVTYEE